MQNCEKCGITLRTKHSDCPLCHGALTGEFDENDRLFPIVAPKKPALEAKIMQWASFGIVAVCFICTAINFMLYDGIWWCLFVIGAALCTWIVMAMAVAKRRNLLKSIMWQLFILALLCRLWDSFTGNHGWSIDYVLPLGILTALIAVLVIAAAQHLTSPEYMVYVLMTCLAGLLPALLLALRVVHTPLPSVISTVICVLTFAALLIFKRKALFSELKKKFHV